MYSIFITEEAKRDLQESVDYFLKISEKLTERFESDLDFCISNLKKSPLIFQMRYKNIRIAYLSNFPFGIHFIIEEENIYILKILHTKRLYI